MSDFKINPRILESIRENSAGDDIVSDFIIKLILEEAYHSKMWHWKDFYLKEVENHFKGWSDNGEN